VSDKCGQFHPVAFVVTSHETTEDFKIFYEALIDMCKTLKVKYKPVYIMQDACPASKEAILLFFPNVIILMCYFHVKKNVRDHKKLMPHENFDDLMRFLTKIHYSHNKDEFKKNINAFKKTYENVFPAMYEYCASWFEGVWSNWQIYHTKPGCANTNSNIESFNRSVKRFTDRKKMTMTSALKKIFKIIVYYSTEFSEFETKPKYNKKTKEVAALYTKSNFTEIRANKIRCTGKNSTYILILNDKNSDVLCSCTCKYFIKSAVCAHLLAYSNLNDLNLFGRAYSKPVKPVLEKFISRNKKGAKKKVGAPKKVTNCLERE